MLDFNFWEITLIAVLAVIVFGPEKLPEFARKAARIIAYLRRIGNDARSQLRAELGPEFDEVRLSDLNPRTFVQRHLLTGEEVEDFRAIREEVRSTGRLLTDSAGDTPAPTTRAAAAAAVPGVAAAAASSSPPHAEQTPPPAAPAPPVSGERVVPFDPEAT